MRGSVYSEGQVLPLPKLAHLETGMTVLLGVGVVGFIALASRTRSLALAIPTSNPILIQRVGQSTIHLIG